MGFGVGGRCTLEQLGASQYDIHSPYADAPREETARVGLVVQPMFDSLSSSLPLELLVCIQVEVISNRDKR